MHAHEHRLFPIADNNIVDMHWHYREEEEEEGTAITGPDGQPVTPSAAPSKETTQASGLMTSKENTALSQAAPTQAAPTEAGKEVHIYSKWYSSKT